MDLLTKTIWQLWNSGKSVEDIAKMVGIETYYVEIALDYVKEHGE